MGVNARVVVRRTGEPLTPAKLARLAKTAARELPQLTFCAVDDWTDCSFATCPTVQQFLDGERGSTPELWDPEDLAPVLRAPKNALIFEQDGPPIIGAVGEQLIEISTNLRYFNDESFRGRWPDIEALIVWLEKAIPDCEVWYGSDEYWPVAPLPETSRERYRLAYRTVHERAGSC